jgi:hypothetical protein
MSFLLDFHKVIWAKLYYKNQEGSKTPHLSSSPTVHGEFIVNPDEDALPRDLAYPGETRLERARRLDLLDVWIPRCEMLIYCRELIVWERQRALDMYKAYCIFLMSNNKNKRKTTKNEKKSKST